MILKGIYDAFLRYGLVIAIVTLWFPILNDKKKETKKYMFYIHFEYGYVTVTKKVITDDYFSLQPKSPKESVVN